MERMKAPFDQEIMLSTYLFIHSRRWISSHWQLSYLSYVTWWLVIPSLYSFSLCMYISVRICDFRHFMSEIWGGGIWKTEKMKIISLSGWNFVLTLDRALVDAVFWKRCWSLQSFYLTPFLSFECVSWLYSTSEKLCRTTKKWFQCQCKHIKQNREKLTPECILNDMCM